MTSWVSHQFLRQRGIGQVNSGRLWTVPAGYRSLSLFNCQQWGTAGDRYSSVVIDNGSSHSFKNKYQQQQQQQQQQQRRQHHNDVLQPRPHHICMKCELPTQQFTGLRSYAVVLFRQNREHKQIQPHQPNKIVATRYRPISTSAMTAGPSSSHSMAPLSPLLRHNDRFTTILSSTTIVIKPTSSGSVISANTRTHRCYGSSSHAHSDGHHHEQDHGHDHHKMEYEPPTGWLWGIPPGVKREREGWERTWYIGLYGTTIVAAILLALKPDTSVQTWALEEARRRLESEGIIEDTHPTTTE